MPATRYSAAGAKLPSTMIAPGLNRVAKSASGRPRVRPRSSSTPWPRFASRGELKDVAESKRPVVSGLDRPDQCVAKDAVQAPPPSTGTERAVVTDLDMAELAGEAGRSPVQPAAGHQAGPDPAGEPQVQEAARAPSGTKGGFS